MKAKEDEFFTKNAEFSIEFSKYVLEHPELDDILDGDSILIFLPEFEPALKEYNLKIAQEIQEEGSKVIYVTLQSMKPTPLSRLEGVEIDLKEPYLTAVNN